MSFRKKISKERNAAVFFLAGTREETLDTNERGSVRVE
jgi:hypothetical protein